MGMGSKLPKFIDSGNQSLNNNQASGGVMFFSISVSKNETRSIFCESELLTIRIKHYSQLFYYLGFCFEYTFKWYVNHEHFEQTLR